MTDAVPAAPIKDLWRDRVAFTWLRVIAPLALVCAVYLATRPGATINDVFLVRQDMPVGLSCLALMILIAMPAVRLGSRAASAVEGFVDRHGLALCLIIAALVAGGALAGWRLVYQSYPLSLDEFWATFDARVFGRGIALAKVAPQWRPFVPALEPMWRLDIPGNGAWASTYLPMNAALRGFFGVLGSQALSGAFWAALSIWLTYSLGRQFWPQRRDAAVVAAVLMASSSQLIVIAMSPYAMSAHLALNMGWLWLFLRKGPVARAASVLIAFAATGLHQFIFHPLFAAPFILQLWLQRRWRLAAFYTAAYGLICLFWVLWWPILFASQGLPIAAAHAAATGASAEALAMAFSPLGPSLMAENLVRFITWQNPVTVPLAIFGARAAWSNRDGPLLPLAAGVILVLVFLVAITPFQGHGWGYRYLHGYLGSFCLLAALAWVRLTESADATRGRGWACLGVATLGALCLMLPIRLLQVHDFIQPYARSWAAMERAPVDVVIVDPSGLWYANDLVRNDPFLEQGPKIMHRYRLTTLGMRILCAHYRVGYFDHHQGVALGIAPVVGGNAADRAADLIHNRLRPPSCARMVAVR